MSSFDPAEYMEQMRRQMDAMLQDTQEHSDQFAESEHIGTGETDEGRVRVEISSLNGVKEVWIDPKAMRHGSEDLAAFIKEAIDYALQDIHTAINDSDGPMSSLNSFVEEVENSSGDGTFASGMRAIQEQLQQNLNKTTRDLEEKRRRLEELRVTRTNQSDRTTE